jgi:hypothetical protein
LEIKFFKIGLVEISSTKFKIQNLASVHHQYFVGENFKHKIKNLASVHRHFFVGEKNGENFKMAQEVQRKNNEQ